MKEEEKFDLEKIEGNEVDKRLQMFKNLREQMLTDLSNIKANE